MRITANAAKCDILLCNAMTCIHFKYTVIVQHIQVLFWAHSYSSIYCNATSIKCICVFQGKGTQKTFWLKKKTGCKFPPTEQECDSSNKSASDVSIYPLKIIILHFMLVSPLFRNNNPIMKPDMCLDSLVLLRLNRRKPRQPQQGMQRLKREEQSRGARELPKCRKCTHLLYLKCSLTPIYMYLDIR